MNTIIDPATGLPVLDALWQQVALALFGIASLIISLVIGYIGIVLRTKLPTALSAYIDKRYMDQIHSAAITIVRRIILEGKDPRTEMSLALEYMTASVKDATARLVKNGRSLSDVRDIFSNIVVSKIPDVLAELAKSQTPQAQPQSLATMDAQPEPFARTGDSITDTP